MKEIFKDKEVEAAILVDATNAFNSINREAMLHNIAVKCPEINRYVQNCYGKPSKLFIVDGKQNGDKCILYSEEGTAQGDPVAMAMYALGLSVLQSELKHEITNVKSVAYADDSRESPGLEEMVGQLNKTRAMLWILPKCSKILSDSETGQGKLSKKTL